MEQHDEASRTCPPRRRRAPARGLWRRPCGPHRPADPAAPVTITWWTGQAADAEARLEGLAKEFTAAHPNVTINVSSGAPRTEELLQKLTAGFASDTYPDTSYAFGSWSAQL